MSETDKPTKLNLGCGQCKLEGYLNVDIDEELKPDEIVDITRPLPYADETFEEVIFFHTIEHITKQFHPTIFSEVRRVLKPNGKFILGYPEFRVCAQYWIDNKRGMKDFWEACIYGRQTSKADFHVALMDSQEVKDVLLAVGFENIKMGAEPENPQYTLVTAFKSEPRPTYQEYLKETIFGNK